MILSIILYVTLTVVLGLLCFHYYLHGGRRAALIDKIPGPRSLPILGNSTVFLEPTANLFYKILQLNTDYYPIYKLRIFNKVIVTIMHPDDIGTILSSKKNIVKGMHYEFVRPWLGDGLLISNGGKWQTRRKILTPAFHFSILPEFVSIFDERAKDLVKSMKAHNGALVKDIGSFMSDHTLNLICETAMGNTLDSRNTSDREYRQAVCTIGKIFAHRLFKPWTHLNWLFNMTSMGRTHAKMLEVLHGFTKGIITERIQYHEALEEKESGETISSEDQQKSFEVKKRKMAMLEILITAWRKTGEINLGGIQEEVDTFTFEGHDTTATALTFALLCLAEYSSVQKRCREEVDTVFRESDGKLGIPELQRLCYLEQVVKESLRLYPAVPLIARKLTEDLNFKDYVVPAGTTVQLHIYSLHRDPNFWENPEVFDPDRFSPDRLKGRHPFSYVPFSAGPRNCIGQKFAMYEVKGLIAHLIHNFIIEPVDSIHDLRYYLDAVLRPAKPVNIKFTPRSQIPVNN